MLTGCFAAVESKAHLHDDENSSKDRQEASPCDPSNLLKLPWTSSNKYHYGCDDGEVIRAERMVGESIECRRCADDARSSDKNESNEKEYAC